MSITRTIIKTTALGCIFAATNAHAANYIWTGAFDANDFTNVNNWLDKDTGLVPTMSPDNTIPTEFNGGATNVANYNAAGTQQVNAIYVSSQTGTGSGTGGVLNVSAGTLQGTGQNTRYTYGGKGQTGTVNISGTGTIDVGGGTRVGIDSNSVGTLNISDSGTYKGSRGLTANSISVSTIAGQGNATGNINVSGSGTYQDRFGLMLGGFNSTNTGTGNFNIIGGNATVQLGFLNSGSDGKWLQSGDGSTLGATIDSSDGFSLSTIEIYDHGTPTDGRVSFEAGALLNLGFSGAAQAGSWTLMSWGEDFLFEDGGLALDPGVDSNWSFEFVDTGGTTQADSLVVTYVPEPSSTALLGLGGLALILRRRK
ncbi:PEP-CTERM sorting domain-containing protein [Verrucomicrobiaceae bacterium R5-34]|nr:PEP-CTERM sorting domain-containing protein [Verrucomicrobiaceae bacterium R5-34]